MHTEASGASEERKLRDSRLGKLGKLVKLGEPEKLAKEKGFEGKG